MSEFGNLLEESLSLTQQMLMTLRTGNWSEFLSLMQAREQLVVKLQACPEGDNAAVDEAEIKRQQQILAAISEINRELVSLAEKHRKAIGKELADLNLSLKANALYQETKKA